MTADEESELLDRIGEQIDQAAAFALQQYQTGVPVDVALVAFRDAVAAAIAAGLSAIGTMTLGTASVLEMRIGEISLSERLYALAQEVSANVRTVVQQHALGFQDARQLALDLYTGYGLRPAEVLQFRRTESLLPQYLRDALLPDLEDDFARIFARLAVDNLSTAELQAAYGAVLTALDELQTGRGRELLARRLRVALQEKARYLAKRIAQTELHRAYAERQARELMLDTDVQYVQWRLSRTHPRADICDYFATVDRWGLGPGVYPKEAAPVPGAHPFCRCVLAPRLDLQRQRPRVRRGADRAYFASMDADDAARIAGSREKLQRILDGQEEPIDIHNDGRPAQYQVREVAEVAADGTR